MRILVPIKRVIDYAIKPRIHSSKSAVEKQGIKHSMNPFCEIAVEEAVRLREREIAEEVIALTIGQSHAVETLRTALALGCDRAIHVTTDMPIDTDLQPLAVSKIIQQIVKKNDCKMVILGKQSIDDDSNQTGQLLAGLLDWPQATFASKVKVNKKDNNVEVDREVDGGLQTLKLRLPAVITTDLRLNTPRYAKLPNIMKAKKKPIETMKLDDLGIDVTPRVTVKQLAEPPKRQGGIKVESVDELYDKLKNEAKVL